MNITVSDRAAKAVHRIVEDNPPDEGEVVHLRIKVVGGGCSGFQHKLELDTEIDEKKDLVHEVNGVKVVIDHRSALYLDGVIVDFHDDLNKHGFSVNNPNAKTTCGCGSSFSM